MPHKVDQSPLLSRELAICEFNVENLFISMEYYQGQDLTTITEPEWRLCALPQLRPRQKPIVKLWGLSEAVLEINPDIAMLVEVGGKDSLESFSRFFLQDRYTPYFVEGNSRRGIDLGFLVRREIGYRVEVLSNKETPIEVYTMQGKYSSRFSRDVAELRLYDENRLILIVLLTHLKSKLSTEKDSKGKDVRTAEAIALAALYRKLRAMYPNVPIILGGDFNADLSSLELELLNRTDLTDFRDEVGVPSEDRFTLIHFDSAGGAYPVVLDYLLVSPELRQRIVKSKSYIFRYKGFHGIEQRPPNTPQGRYQLPSDHYPLVLTVLV